MFFFWKKNIYYERDIKQINFLLVSHLLISIDTADEIQKGQILGGDGLKLIMWSYPNNVSSSFASQYSSFAIVLWFKKDITSWLKIEASFPFIDDSQNSLDFW